MRADQSEGHWLGTQEGGLKETGTETDLFRAELDSVRRQMCFLSINTYKPSLVVNKKYNYGTENMPYYVSFKLFKFFTENQSFSVKKKQNRLCWFEPRIKSFKVLKTALSFCMKCINTYFNQRVRCWCAATSLSPRKEKKKKEWLWLLPILLCTAWAIKIIMADFRHQTNELNSSEWKCH